MDDYDRTYKAANNINREMFKKWNDQVKNPKLKEAVPFYEDADYSLEEVYHPEHPYIPQFARRGPGARQLPTIPPHPDLPQPPVASKKIDPYTCEAPPEEFSDDEVQAYTD
jgi:hypothetical protein